MLFTILRHQPLAVDTARNAAEGMAKVQTCDYALVLIDMDLENDEAVTFLTRFRDERPDATTFIIAARDPKKDIAFEPNVSAVLNKPLEIDTLAEVVRECAVVVPPPDDPLPCPPSESDVRSAIERGPLLPN